MAEAHTFRLTDTGPEAGRSDRRGQRFGGWPLIVTSTLKVTDEASVARELVDRGRGAAVDRQRHDNTGRRPRPGPPGLRVARVEAAHQREEGGGRT